MPSRRTRVARSAAQGELAAALAALHASLDLPGEFAPEVVDEADAAAAAVSLDPDAAGVADLRHLEFCTIDPEGSTDLDQALHLARDGDEVVVHYAIADVPVFVVPGRAVDVEARGRGQTLYAADGRIPLHPTELSEDAASLLPDRDRRAFVWRFRLDAEAGVLDVALERAVIRSRRQWTYTEGQAAIDAGSAPESLAVLAWFGPARLVVERERGGASLNTPDEQITLGPNGYRIERRVPLPLEEWNAQLSLMTGMAAAELMLAGRVGILRTMPAADPESVAAFRAQTGALGLPWLEGVDYGEYLRSLDRADPAALAIRQAATGLFRGAGYVAFDGELPAETMQAAIGAPYAHATAPLRRLVDRWVLEICAALSANLPVPAWARDSLSELPKLMARAAGRAGQLDTASIDRVEAALLSGRTGEDFDAVVLSRRGESARIQIANPAVTATVESVPARPGEIVTVRLVGVDIADGRIDLVVVGDDAL